MCLFLRRLSIKAMSPVLNLRICPVSPGSHLLTSLDLNQLVYSWLSARTAEDGPFVFTAAQWQPVDTAWKLLRSQLTCQSKANDAGHILKSRMLTCKSDFEESQLISLLGLICYRNLWGVLMTWIIFVRKILMKGLPCGFLPV